MSDWQEYIKDPRTVCKYGEKCYQRNPEHRTKFKHPPKQETPKIVKKVRERKFSPYSRNKLELDKKGEGSNLKSVELPSVLCTKEPDELQNTEVPIEIPIPDNITYVETQEDNKIFRDLFLTEMPSDFFQFYDFLKGTEKPVLNVLAGVNLELIGPYDLLLGKLPVLDDKDLYLIHWRFFFDPPEFQAVLKRKGDSQYHIGYFRDSPDDKPVFLGSNDSAKDCRITPLAENMFAAVYNFLENEKKKSPFTSIACKKLMDIIKKWTEEHNISLDPFKLNKRLSSTVTKTFHGAGIVVPYNKGTQLGYRPLVETDANLKKLFTRLEVAKTQEEKNELISEIQPVITYASIAVDECDFGTSLEAGVDLFCSGLKELEPKALCCMEVAYNCLNRDAFTKIIRTHLKYRRKGANMSLLHK